MSPSDIQLKKAYEEGLTPEQIAEEMGGYSTTAVKAKLMSISAKYRKDCGMEIPVEGEDGLNFTDAELRDVNKVLLDTALNAEDPNLRFKAATYIRDDKKGRKEVVKAVASNTFNILQLNQHLAEARQITNKQLNRITQLSEHAA